MPGLHRTYHDHGKKRLRRTPYRYIGVRDTTWWNIRRLSQKLNLRIVDMIDLLVAKNLEALHADPLTGEDLEKPEETT